jgi:hypothetical protein
MHITPCVHRINIYYGFHSLLNFLVSGFKWLAGLQMVITMMMYDDDDDNRNNNPVGRVWSLKFQLFQRRKQAWLRREHYR